ncbi:hypothetical protein ACM26V_22190 [Salipaludibacillus sp. HK11]|uniref:hypothetical protein n=1 Tax=Salipaludibacillus sp. HK11 TaxID=3394320 RepID=UPI0039FC38FE
MSGETLWSRVISGLSSSGEDLQTTTGLWFSRASVQGEKLYIDSTTERTPSCNLSKQRSISKKDFLFVYSYYDRWVNGETGVRHEVTRKLRNTAYIFSLISRFAD